MYEILKSTLEYLAKKGADADPMTATAYEYFKQIREVPCTDSKEQEAAAEK